MIVFRKVKELFSTLSEIYSNGLVGTFLTFAEISCSLNRGMGREKQKRSNTIHYFLVLEA